MPADRFLHPRLGHSQKVQSLSFHDRWVWVIYQLAADDFGVMRASAAPLKNADDTLERETDVKVLAALERLIACGLLQMFEHQGCRYVYQRDWQDFQHARCPRQTILPPPPTDALARCSPQTRHLFQFHPGGRKIPAWKSPDNSPEDSGNNPGKAPEDSGKVPAPRARARPLAVSREPLAVSREPLAVSRWGEPEPSAPEAPPPAPEPVDDEPPYGPDPTGAPSPADVYERFRQRAAKLRHVSLALTCPPVHMQSLVEFCVRYPDETKRNAIIDQFLTSTHRDVKKARLNCNQLAACAATCEEELAQARASPEDEDAAWEAVERWHRMGEGV